MATPELTESEREQIVAVLQDLDPAAPKEKRRGARRKVLMELSIRHIPKTGRRVREDVILANVSRKGVAILREKPLEPGERFTALLEFTEGGASLALYSVRNARRLSSGLFKVGAQLMDLLEDATAETKTPGDWVG